MNRRFFAIPLLVTSLAGAWMPTQAQEGAVEPLIAGADIGSLANGLFFDPAGHLVIASVLANSLTVVDVDTHEIVGRYNQDQGVFSPDDLFITADGTIYYGNLLTGEVGKIDPSGVRSTVAQLPPGVNPVTMSDDGRLFVSLCFLGDDLYEISLDGSEPRLIAGDFGGCGLNGMDFGPDGLLYGPLWFGDKIVKVDVDSGEVTTVAEGVGVPAALKFNSQGELFALDTLSGNVMQIDTATGAVSVYAQLEPGLDNLAFNSEDRLFVSSYVTGEIFEVMADGSHETVMQGGLSGPGGLALLDDDTLAVGDFLSLRTYTTDGELLYMEPDIVAITSLGTVNTVEPDKHKGQVITTSWFTNAVRVWDIESETLLEDYTDFAVPLNALRFNGDLIVAELGTGHIVQADKNDPSQRTILTDVAAVPVGLATDDHDLYISDWVTGTIWQLIDNRHLLDEPRVVVTGLANPEGMELTADGSALIVVTPGSDSVVRVDIETGEVTTVAEGLGLGMPTSPGYPPSHIPSDVAVADDGTIYVSADVNVGVYVIHP
jgi:sugar lactone lactonase YvrE